ncbi:MAG: hypothetical protein GY749_04820 [Desulfobacteraceae bacterium]|nr:hypothetical protein [Desulfobacteraceae bacterium]
MFLKNMKIGVRLGLGFSLILMITAITLVVTLLSLKTVQNDTSLVKKESLPSALLADKMAFQTLDVMKLILYASTTHQSQGFKDAEKVVKSFNANLAEFRKLYKDRDNTKTINDLETAFNKYYELGKDMAYVYFTEGVEEGNMLVDEFDKAAKDLTGKMNRLQIQKTNEAESSITSILTSVDRIKAVMFATSLTVLVIGFIAAFFITRSITIPIRQVTKFADNLYKGDLSDRLPMGRPINCSDILDCGKTDCVCFDREICCWTEAGSFSNNPTCFEDQERTDCHTCKVYKKAAPNELQEMGLTLNAMAETMDAKANVATAMADGNLDQNIREASEKDSLGKALKDMIEGLNNIICQVNEAALQVFSTSDQVSDSSQSLSKGTDDQLLSLEETTTSMIQIESQTKANAEHAFQANQIAGQARESADQGKQEMGNMILAIEDINEASQAVSKIVKVIDEIAFQINLLSLNAAVEAARAGRHGKGFAVVAGEVRNLANRSAKAARETAELIEGAMKKVEKGNEIASQTAEALDRIVESTTKVAELVSAIATSSSEQAQATAQVNQGLRQIDKVTQQNSVNASETASAAEELAGQASQLRQILAQFKLNKKALNNNHVTESESLIHAFSGSVAEGYHPASLEQRDFSV